MERPHVTIQVHPRMGKLVSIKDVLGVLEFYKKNISWDSNLKDDLEVKGAVYAVEALIGEVGSWEAPSEMIGN